MNPWRLVTKYRPHPHFSRLANWGKDHDNKPHSVTQNDGLRVVSYRFSTPSKTPIRLAFVADLHYQNNAKSNAIVNKISKVLKQQNVDLLILGGDVVGYSSDLKFLPEALNKLGESVQEKIAIPGNWERGKRWILESYWNKLFEDCGYDFLLNKSKEYNGFYFYGCDDLCRFPEITEKIPISGNNILLSHRPDTVIELDSLGRLDNFFLTICGHTHGGQVRLPGIGAILPFSLYGRLFDYGTFSQKKENGLKMLVSSGCCELSFPFRFNCRREILLVNINCD